ncbi:MAG: periplasmic heavy metal sensor [Chlorobi bacterium]|nr:periplasmic heavy metal sensor [Chlorobiota bacterium]
MGYGRLNGAGRGYFCNNLPNITEEQKNKLDAMRTEHWKNVQNTQNLIAEKIARLRTLRTADNVDMKEINKTIDELNSLRTQIQKSREQHIQDVRKLLTDEQRVYFDNFQNTRGQRFGRGMGRGMGRCGRGYGRGPGFGAGNATSTARPGYGRGPGRGFGPCGRWQ